MKWNKFYSYSFILPIAKQLLEDIIKVNIKVNIFMK